MFSFFYNILTTLTGGKSFEQLSQSNLRKVRATLDGDKLSDIDAQVFGRVLKRQKGESFFRFLDRRSKLSKLSLEDKQRLIESEKKRLVAEERRKRSMLDAYVSGSNQTPAQAQGEEVRSQVSRTMSNTLSSLDSAIFDSLASRKESEPLFTYLKRSKAMYRLPVEDKRKLVSDEQHRVEQEKASQQRMLEEYLQPTSYEKISRVENQVSESVENTMSNDSSRRVNKSKGISR